MFFYSVCSIVRCPPPQDELLSKCLLADADGRLAASLQSLCANMLGLRPVADDLNKLVRFCFQLSMN